MAFKDIFEEQRKKLNNYFGLGQPGLGTFGQQVKTIKPAVVNKYRNYARPIVQKNIKNYQNIGRYLSSDIYPKIQKNIQTANNAYKTVEKYYPPARMARTAADIIKSQNLFRYTPTLEEMKAQANISSQVANLPLKERLIGIYKPSVVRNKISITPEEERLARSGYEKTLSTVDMTGGIGRVGAEITSRVIQNISKATTKSGVKKALGTSVKNYSDDVIKTLAKTKDTKVISQILENARRGIPRATSLGQKGITRAPEAKLPVKPISEAKVPLKGVTPPPVEVSTTKGIQTPLTTEKTIKGLQPSVSPAGKGQLFNVPVGKQRGFLKTVKTSEQTLPQIKKNIKVLRQNYQPITNKQALAKADEILKQGSDIAREKVLSKEPVSAEKSALAIKLMKKYEAEGNDELLLEVLNDYDKQLRSSGQFIQAASLWNNLSPAGMVRLYRKTAEKLGIKTEKEAEKMILGRMKEIAKLSEAEKPQATLDLLKGIAQKLPPKLDEIFTSYRYQNMLSNPRTTERNIYQGLFNTLITRPATLLTQAGIDAIKNPFNPMAREVYFSDVPKYYKDIVSKLPDAYTAAKEMFKTGLTGKFDINQTGMSTLEAMRRENIPKPFTDIPRFMEAQDKFISSLIAGGEKARLMKRGVGEKEAEIAATNLAEKYLYRNKLGQDMKDKDVSYIVRALDGLGNFALQGRKIPVVGKAYEWFVPFVSVPINAAKFMVEQTPANLIGGKITTEKAAQAVVGAVAMAYGANLAMQDRVSWAAPTDPKAKELFYASGRKPYSVLIGDKWVPMWYFGPYALSIAIPAAYKHYAEESRTAMTDDEITKVTQALGDISRFVVSQTPLQGVSAFFRVLDGDQDLNMGSIAGFTAGQVIPAEGFVRYVNTLIDPVYRKAKGFTQTIKKDLPFLSQTLEAYKNPLGEESKRNITDYIAPYTMGQRDLRFEQPFKARINKLQENAQINAMKKNKKEGTVASGRTVAQIGDEFKEFDTPEEAQKAIDEYNFDKSGKKSQIIGDTYYYRDKSGNPKSMTISEYKTKVRKSKMDIAYNNNNYEEWTKLALEELADIESRFDEADELTQMELLNEYQDLLAKITKYQSYGGFNKPKKGKKLKISAPEVGGLKVPVKRAGKFAFKTSSAPKINIVSTKPKQITKSYLASIR